MKRIIILIVIVFLILAVLGGVKRNRERAQQEPILPGGGDVQVPSPPPGKVPVPPPGVGIGGGGSGSGNPTAPASYQALYAELDTALNGFNQSVQSQWDGSSHRNLVFGTELLSVNGNLGENLLAKQTFDGTVLLLQRLDELEIEGVKVNINYPLLVTDFPRSGEYLAFYKNVFREIRKRNMKTFVQMTPVFADPAISSIRVDYSGLTLEKYRQEMRQQLETIVSELKPDYVAVAQEPGTAAANTGLSALKTLDGYVGTVDEVTEGMNPSGTLLGAGIGTWEDAEFVSRLSQNPNLDFIDLHIYPLGNGFTDYLQQTIEMADRAKAQGKKVTLGEMWLSKASAKEVGGGGGIATSTNRFKRDVFGFWAPLDSKFLEATVNLAHYKKFEFISPFWSKYFFAYLEYDAKTEALPYSQVSTMSSRAAGQNIVSGTFSQTGLKYKELIKQ